MFKRSAVVIAGAAGTGALLVVASARPRAHWGTKGRTVQSTGAPWTPGSPSAATGAKPSVIRAGLALPRQQRRAVPLRYAQRVPVYDRHRGPEGRGRKDPEQRDGSGLSATPGGGQHRAPGE